MTNRIIETLKSAAYSLFIFCSVGPLIGAVIFAGVEGESPLGILFFAYFMGVVPAAAACVINWCLYLSLKNRIAIPDYLLGASSGLLLLIALVVLKGFPSHLSNGVALLLVFIVPAAVCSTIVNPCVCRKADS